MKIFRKRFILLIIFMLSTLYAAAASGASGRILTTMTLDSGLSVIIEEDHGAPVAALQMWVRVGSADESEKEAGIAHVFEHMLFKGTSTRKVGELAKEIDSAGGYINAYTSFDQTVYHLAVASRYFDTGLDVLSDAIQNSSFDPDELKKELEVVFEEIRRGEDNPTRKLFSSLMDSAYSTHTYRRPVIGFNSTVGSFTRDDILAFFRKWYVPNNMTLVIVGDVDTNEVLDSIRMKFGNFKRKKEPHSPRLIEPQQRDTRVRVITQPINGSRLSLGFHIPGLEHNDTYALDMLSVILGQGNSSRLFRKLKIERELVDSITASSMTPKDPGLFIINALLKAGDINGSVAMILEEVEKLRAEGPTHEEMKRALVALESDFIYERETMQGKASQLGYYDTLSGGLAFEEKYITGIRGVDPEDISRVIGKYLRSVNMTAVALLSEDEGPLVSEAELTTAINAAAMKIENSLVDGPERAEIDAATLVKLDNGIRLILKEEHSNPTVAFYATFPGGLRDETARTNGIGFFSAAMLSRGTGRWDRIELAGEIEALAGSVSAFSGRNSIGIKGSFLSKDFDYGLEIIAEMLNNPALAADEIEKLKKDVITAIERDADNLAGRAFELLRAELYADHPYSLPLKGRPDSVSSFKKRDIKRHLKRHLRAEDMVFAIVGDFDIAHARKRVSELFGGSMGARKPSGKRGPKKSAPGIGVGGLRSTVEMRDKAQIHIAIGFPGTTISEDDRFHLAVLDEVLSGQGGRLFVELRDTQSLAYVVSAFSNPGVDPGLFGIYIATAPEKKERAIKEIMRIIGEVREDGITGEELDRAKRGMIGSYEIGLQSALSQVSEMAINELLGLGYDFHLRYPEEINRVTGEDVLKAAEKYLTPDSYVISIVGPKGSKE